MSTVWTTEQLADRWIDKRNIQNLVGKYMVDLHLKREGTIFARYWADRPDNCLSFNEGSYVGGVAIRRYYENEEHLTAKRTALLLRLLDGKIPKQGTAEELYGMGQQRDFPIDNGLIELAEDGMTAKGLWHLFGADHTVNEYGAVSYWDIGYFAVDFILEDGTWRLWHVLHATDIHSPIGSDWADPPVLEERDEFSEAKKWETVPFTVRRQNYERYSPERPFTKPPRLPEPYVSFADTFSYGV